MKRRPGKSSATALRRRAEARFSHSAAGSGRPAATRQVHELQVHQIELEMQNEELRSSRAQVEEGLDRFTQLYDFAPVGYFTLEPDGLIAQTNLTGARLLGQDRARLPGKRFSGFVAEPARPAFQLFLRNVFRFQTGQTCELALLRSGGPARIIQIDAMLSADGKECRAVVADITERKQAAEEIKLLNLELEERVRRRTQTIRRLSIELTLAEKRERTRLAHVLHADLQQRIVGSIFLLQSVYQRLAVKKDRTQIRTVTRILKQTIEVARTLAVELSPPILQTDGLVVALRWLARSLKQNHGLVVKVTGPANQPALPEVASFVLYQAVQELLFNVIKHAKVKSAGVVMDCVDDQIRIVVSDKGTGFEVAPQPIEAASPDQWGLFSVSERLGLLDGRLEIASAPGQGSRFTLWMPLRPAGVEGTPGLKEKMR